MLAFGKLPCACSRMVFIERIEEFRLFDNLRDSEIKLNHAQTIESVPWATAGHYYGIAYL